MKRVKADLYIKRVESEVKKNALKYFLYLTILLLGIAIGIALDNYYQFPLTQEINIVDAATLIVTIFLAVYIPGVFDRKLQQEENRKELIIGRIEQLQSYYRITNQIVQDGDITEKDRNRIDNILSIGKNRFAAISILIEHLKVNVTFEDELKEISGMLVQYTELLEKYPVPEGADFPTEITDREEELFNKIDTATTILIFKLNEA